MKKNWWKWLVALVLVLVMAGMIFSYWQRIQVRAAAEKVYTEQIAATKNLIEQIETEVADGELERVAGKQQISEQTPILTQLLEQLQEESHTLLPATVTKIEEQINSVLEEILVAADRVGGLKRLGALTPIYNARIAKADFTALTAAMIGGQAWLANPDQKEALSIDLESKSFTLVPLNEGPNNRLQTGHNAGHYWQIEGQRIQTYDLTDNEINVEWPRDLEGETVALLVGENNLYFIQNNPQKIFRQRINPRTEVERALREWWVKDGDIRNGVTQPDLALVSDVTIDNSIWLAQTDGGIFKLTGGDVSRWQIKDWEGTMSGPIRIDTNFNDDNGSLLILSPDDARVLMVNKATGELEQELISESFKGAVDIIDDAENGRFFVVQNEAIFEVKVP